MTILNLSFNEVNVRIALRHTPTAQAVVNALPFHATVQTWGREVIFDCPIQVPIESTATNIVKVGDIGFWSDGSCITIAYGPTPISRDGEIRLACNCNIWGDALDDVSLLKQIKPGTPVNVDIWHTGNLEKAG